MPITRIVSGGQTGADRGGLDAALYCDISHGGWCPRGRKAEDNIIPFTYQMTEIKSASYLKRTELNVLDSDATVVFTRGTPSGGSLRTIEFCLQHRKPWHNIDIALDTRERATEQVVRWLRGEIAFDYGEYQARPPANCVLNVAGSRESKAPRIQAAVQAILIDVISAVNGKLFYPLPDSKHLILLDRI